MAKEEVEELFEEICSHLECFGILFVVCEGVYLFGEGVYLWKFDAWVLFL